MVSDTCMVVAVCQSHAFPGILQRNVYFHVTLVQIIELCLALSLALHERKGSPLETLLTVGFCEEMVNESWTCP